MRPPGSDALAGNKESGKKRLPSDSNEDAPPKKRNKVHKDDEEGVHGPNKDTTDVESKRVKVEDDKEDESIERGARVVAVGEARLARRQGPTTVTVNWVELPTALFGRVFEWLSFTEGRYFFASNKSILWREKRVEYESQMLHTLVLPGTPPLSFLGTLAEVHTLDFGPHCTDEHLEYMCDERVLPKLKHLAMARSLQVTDEGLSSLAENPTRCRTLETLDITFCHLPTYGFSLVLRDRLKALVLIRRQPKWMDGKTVFARETCLTYWPDGSFTKVQANGRVVDSGYFCDLFDLDSENHVICKSQFVDAVQFSGGAWQSALDAEWMRYAYRPAVVLLYCSDQRTVLRALSLKGSYPFHGFPHPEHASSIRIGGQAYFDRQGGRCYPDYRNACVTVAHHRPGPLDEWMPPPDLVEKFRAHKQDMERVMAGRDPERDERELHIRTGGLESNEPPPQWFQFYPIDCICE